MPETIRERLQGFDTTAGYPRLTLGASETPLLAAVDVLVCGGGTAGAIAAIAAARQGAATMVVEPLATLGGIMTGGGIHWYYHGVSSDLQHEMDERVEAVTRQVGSSANGYHPDTKKLVLQEMAEEAGVQFAFRRAVIGVLKHDATVIGVIVDGPNGREALRAKVVIDATGDVDVAALAGARFVQGRERDGMMMAYSVVPGRVGEGNSAAFSNYDAGWVDPTDATDVGRAFAEGRSLLWREPFTVENRATQIAPLLGLREARLIEGDTIVTWDDMLDGRRFADTIGRCRSHYDNHSSDYANESEEAAVYCDVAGCWQDMVECDIPYGCMLPVGIEGLLVACRGVSITHDAQSALRMQRDMMKLGEAAGMAAAQAVQSGRTPRGIDIGALQAALVAAGTMREEDLPGRAAPPQAPGTEMLIAQLAGDDRGAALFSLYRRGASSELVAALGSDQPDIRIGAALVLGLHGDNRATEPLLVCLRERYAEPPKGPRSRPRWFSAAVALARVGGADVGDELASLLLAEDGSPDLWLHVLRGLQRMQHRAAVSAIREFLTRIRADEKLWNDPHAITAVGWKLELAAAEALIGLGEAEEGRGVAARYADDRRAPVKRYARRLLGQD